MSARPQVVTLTAGAQSVTLDTAAVRAATVAEAVRPAVVCIVWRDTVREFRGNNPISSRGTTALAIDGTAADIRERVRAALARTDLVPIHHVKGITDIVTRALGVQP